MRYKSMAAALFASVPLVAAAQSNITIYGLVDAGLSVEDIDIPNTDSHVVISSGNQSVSRIGFRGTEDLSSDLKALFNIEAGFAIDTGVQDNPLFQRRAVVGVQSARFGLLTIGREYSPIAAISGATDILGQGFYGTNLSAFGTGRLTRRLSNSVNYRSNAIAGLTGSLAYSAGEAIIGPSGNLWGAGLEYGLGPLFAGVGFHVVNRIPGSNDKEWIVGAGYKYEQFEARGNWMVAQPAGPFDRYKEYNVGLSMELGRGKVFLNFKQSKLADGPRGNTYAAAASYALTKRTNLYTAYGTVRNNDGATFGLFSAGTTLAPPPTAPGADPWAWTIGVRHTF